MGLNERRGRGGGGGGAAKHAGPPRNADHQQLLPYSFGRFLNLDLAPVPGEKVW